MILQVRYVLASVVSSSHWHPQAQLSQRNKYIRAKKKKSVTTRKPTFVLSPMRKEETGGIDRTDAREKP